MWIYCNLNHQYKIGAALVITCLLLLILPTPVTASESNLIGENCPHQGDLPINIATDCPQLLANLKTNNLLDAIQPAFVDKVSVPQLAALQALLQQNSGNHKLDRQSLTALLSSIVITQKQDANEGVWSQFWDWLKDLKPEQYDAEFNWLLDFIDSLIPSEEILAIVTNIMIYALVVVSLGLIIWELFLAGLFNGLARHKQPAVTNKLMTSNSVAATLSIAEIKALTPIKQIAALLNCAIAKLIERQQLPEDSALTNRQLIHHLEQQQTSVTLPFTQLVQQSEPVLYGDSQPSVETLAQCWQNTELICTD